MEKEDTRLNIGKLDNQTKRFNISLIVFQKDTGRSERTVGRKL